MAHNYNSIVSLPKINLFQSILAMFKYYRFFDTLKFRAFLIFNYEAKSLQKSITTLNKKRCNKSPEFTF